MNDSNGCSCTDVKFLRLSIHPTYLCFIPSSTQFWKYREGIGDGKKKTVIVKRYRSWALGTEGYEGTLLLRLRAADFCLLCSSFYCAV
jgi:hypothetical protein